MEEDTRLIEEYLSGHEGAVEELVVKYQKQIYAFLYRMTRDMEETKDLTQKTFIQVVQGLKTFRRESSFKTWLYKIALNTCRNHVSRTRHEEVELEERVVEGGADALAAMMEKERREQIRKGLEELPERQRLAIVLRVGNGLSCAEAAGVMGCSEGAVKSNYHFGVTRLRELLKEKGYEVKS